MLNKNTKLQVAAVTASILFGFSGFVALAQEPIVFSQADNKWGSYNSQHNTSVTPSSYFGAGDIATVYDDFTLATDTAVTNIGWTGAYYDGPPQPLNPGGGYGYGPADAGTITGFTIKFWADVVDENTGLHRPQIEAAPLQIVLIDGNAGETDLGYTDAETTYYGPNKMYKYGTTITTPFQATAGTRYWVSVVADSDFAPLWGWETAGEIGKGDAYRQDYLNGPLIKNKSGGDFAFTLLQAGTSEIPATPSITIVEPVSTETATETAALFDVIAGPSKFPGKNPKLAASQALAENPALFGVASEPVQSTRNATTSAVTFWVVIVLLVTISALFVMNRKKTV